MKKYFATSLIVLIASISTNAQTKPLQLGISTSLSFPSGILSSINSVGYGAGITASYQLNGNLYGFAETGIQFFGGKKITYDNGFDVETEKTSKLTHFPFLVGAKYQVEKFGLGLGMGYGSYSSGDSEGSFNGFTINPQVSYDLGKIDIVGQYNSTSVSGGAFNFFGLKAVYKL